MMFYCGGVPRTERLWIKERTITSLGCGVNQTAEGYRKKKEKKQKERLFWNHQTDGHGIVRKKGKEAFSVTSTDEYVHKI